MVEKRKEKYYATPTDFREKRGEVYPVYKSKKYVKHLKQEISDWTDRISNLRRSMFENGRFGERVKHLLRLQNDCRETRQEIKNELYDVLDDVEEGEEEVIALRGLRENWELTRRGLFCSEVITWYAENPVMKKK